MQSGSIFRLKWVDWFAPSLLLPSQYQKQTFNISPSYQLGIAFMLNILSLAVPVMMLQVYDRIIPHQAYGTLTLLIIGVLAALVFDAVLRLARAYLTGWTAASHEHVAGCAAMERFTNADMPAFAQSSTGTHMQNFASLPRLREFYSGQALTALVDMPFILLFLVLIAYLGGVLVLIPFVLLCAFAIISHHAGKWLRIAIYDRSGHDDRKTNYIITVLTGIHTVKALAMEASLLRRFEKHQGEVTADSYRVAMASGFAATLSAVFSQLSLILTATAGSIMVLGGHLSIGALSACTLLAGRALQPVQRMLGTWLRMQDFAISRQQAQELLSLPVQQRDDSALPTPQGTIEMENVSFSYPQNTNFALQDIRLALVPGEVVAISGDKGSGKSTLMQLIAGVLTPVSGNITLDGINPALHSMSELHSHVGYLTQEAVIFKGTILDNITGFMNDEHSIANAKEAGKELGLDKVIDLLPKGYATLLTGGAGDPVPPGVRQRIALARGMRHKPAVLLFDDADRSLDKEGYNLLFKVMGKLKDNCTIVIVSHDHNLLSFADRHYHLEHGTLNEITRNEEQKLIALIKPLRGEKP